MPKSEHIVAKVEEITPTGVILQIDKFQKLKVAARYLPNKIQAGDEMYIDFKTPAEYDKSASQLAQAILNEILGGQDNSN